MRFILIVKPEAEKDIQLAFDWYEEKQLGLGDSFIHEIDSVFDQILNSPKSFQERYRKVRMIFPRQFPFGVHYKIEGNMIIVLAVLHTSRNPKNWRK